MNASPPRSKMGLVVHSFPVGHPRYAMQFLELAHSLGAGGIQTRLRLDPPDTIATLRDRAGEWDLYIEGMAGIPRDPDTSAFEQTVREAKEAGALCIRTACLSGRRYETFDSLAEWKGWVAETKAAVARAVPIVERHKMALGIENHKDWIIEEHLALLREYESEYVGVTLDTGNNISLLDDPYELAEALAPYAVATHFKDMGVEEDRDGFLLAEVPFGEGMLDMPRLAETVRRARPQTRVSLEMITRDPLEITCLTDKYWRTFPDRSGLYLARMLRTVRARQGPPLPRMDALDKAARIRLEKDNVKVCLNFARERMGL